MENQRAQSEVLPKLEHLSTFEVKPFYDVVFKQVTPLGGVTRLAI